MIKLLILGLHIYDEGSTNLNDTQLFMENETKTLKRKLLNIFHIYFGLVKPIHT